MTWETSFSKSPSAKCVTPIESTHVEAIVAAARTNGRDFTATLRTRGDFTPAPDDENEHA